MGLGEEGCNAQMEGESVMRNCHYVQSLDLFNVNCYLLK